MIVCEWCGQRNEDDALECRKCGGALSLNRAPSILSKVVSFVTGTNGTPADWILGIDSSHWNGDIDLALAYAKGARFVIAKATDFKVGTNSGFVDTQVVNTMNKAKELDMPFAGWHWLQPKSDPTIQAEYYMDEFYSKYQIKAPPELDFEDLNVNSWSDMAWRGQVWLEKVAGWTKKKPLVYTAKWFIDLFPDKSKVSFLGAYDLWGAHYIQRSYPTMPSMWTDWKVWQYSDKGDYPYYVYKGAYLGGSWGSKSAYMCMDWFNGSEVEMRAYFGMGSVIPEVPLTLEEQVADHERRISALEAG